MKQERSVHQFRKFLMETDCLLFIGTCPTFYEGFDNVGHPLYDFFDIQVLDELTMDQTIELIHRNLEWEGKTELLDMFDDLLPKIQAMH